MSELTTAKLREILECAKKATPGPWIWPKQFNGSTLWSGQGMRPIVLDAVRHGMNAACLRWRDHEKCLMVKSVDLPGDQSHPDKDHITNMDPQTTIAIIEECLRARGETV